MIVPATSLLGRLQLYRLQTRIGLSVGAVILVLALGLGALLANGAQRELFHVSAENLENLSSQMGRELSTGMARFSREIQDQALRQRFTDARSTPADMRMALDKFKRNHPEFAYVSIVDAATKRVVAANGGIFEGGNAAGRPTFEEGLKGPFLGDVHDAVRLAELLPRPANGEALRFLDVAAPIMDSSGKVSRVFAAHVGWQWTSDIRARVFGPVADKRGVEAFLVDTRGKVVLGESSSVPVGTDLTALLARQTQSATTTTWADGKAYLTFASEVAPQGRFSGFGWRVVARQPVELVFLPANKLRNAFLLGALALGLTAAGIAWFLASHLSKPVRLLAEAARKAEADGEGAEFEQRSGVGEVSDVSRALARLSDRAREQAKAAETYDRQFSVLAESLPQVVWLADAKGALQYVNKEWIRGREPDRPFFIHELEHVIHGDDCPEFTKAWQRALATGADLKIRCRLHTPESETARWFDLEAHAVKENSRRVLRWVGTIFDVHDIVLQTEKSELLLKQERAAREEAERLARMRDEFLATVSHELRSPLSAITGWSDILLKQGNADQTLAKAAAVIRRNALLQARLIDDLLDMTAVMAGKLTLSETNFDLSALAREVTLSHLHAAQQKGVALNAISPSSPVTVHGDSKRISQVLTNLISNAIKFTEAGGKIDVSSSSDETQAHIKVIDTGRGIAASFLPHVFERMRQEDASKTREAGGLGIGLAIAQAVVDLHDGSIQADSGGPGTGATFTVSLPLARADDIADAPMASSSADSVDISGLRVLVVDDEQDAREVAQVALASMGAHIKLAASAAEALDILAATPFDALVSDIGMPHMDGLALIKAVRALSHSSNRNIPAVALTAFALETERQEGLQAGFDAYVTKPISLRRLGEGVKHAQSQRQKKDAG